MNRPQDHHNDQTGSSDRGFVLPQNGRTVQLRGSGANEAADIIRQKLDKIYAVEPDPLKEERGAEATAAPSKHQRFMMELNSSGKDLAQIQTEWHNYYVSLPDDEKHVVWQEFYASNDTMKPAQQPAAVNPLLATEAINANRMQIATPSPVAAKARSDDRAARQVQEDIRETIKKPISRRRRHAHSLLFGLSVGAIVIVINMFTFFNQILIAPFIQPARTEAATPLIVSGETAAPSAVPEVIIPKINVQIPLRFDATSNAEETMQAELEEGVVHYPTTSMPGENGNTVYFGHSSNNIFNKGKYKFAFVLLHKLQIGDTFYITKDSKIYAYKVFSVNVVDPSQVDVLNPVDGHVATGTLITCDPPGSTRHRLVVTGDQISPDPAANTASTAASDAATSTATDQLAGEPSLLRRVLGSALGKIAIGLVVIIAVIVLVRRINRIK